MIQQQLSCHFGRRRESQPFRATRLTENVRDNPDHFAVDIEHWTTRVSLVDGRISLQKLRNCSVTDSVIRRMSRADVSGGQRMAESVRRSDHKDFNSDFHFVRIPEWGGNNLCWSMLELQQCDIRIADSA